MTLGKQEVLWDKLVELKETPGKAGETPEKSGEPKRGEPKVEKHQKKQED